MAKTDHGVLGKGFSRWVGGGAEFRKWKLSKTHAGVGSFESMMFQQAARNPWTTIFEDNIETYIREKGVLCLFLVVLHLTLS